MDEKKNVRSLVLALAIPAIMENLLLSMVEYVDTGMVGSLGPLATAAVAVNVPVIGMLNAVIMAVSVGGTVAVAQSIGGKNMEKARSVTGQAFLAVGTIGLTLGIILFLLGGQIPIWMGAQEEIHRTSTNYIRILALGLPLNYISVVFYGILRGAGDTKTPMKLNVFTNVSNVVGNFLLIFPSRTLTLGGVSFSMWGAGLGVEGAAISTTLARTVSSILAFYIMIHRKDVPLVLKGLRPEKKMLGEIMRIGFPTALERLAISSGQLCYVRVVSGLGTVSLAAHQLALTAESISYMPSHGFQIAATTLVGQSVGAKAYEDARVRGQVTFRLCTICIFGMSLFLFFGSHWILSLFTPSEEVIAQGSQALKIIAFVEPFFGMSSVFTGALRGAGDTKQPFFVCLMTMWGIRIPMAFFFVQFLHWGLAGAWIAMGMDLICRGLLMAYRFHGKGWEERLRRMDYI